jgi:UDP-2-acetamido-2-deoxy-ribo-hexuluronate aminotransferase
MKKKIFYSKPCYSKNEKSALIKYCSNLKENWFGEFSETKKLEDNLKKISNCKFVHAVSSGTAALLCAWHALGIKKNDEVLITSYTHIATANTAGMFGAKLKQIDIESSTGGACYEDLIKKTTKKTKCIAISAINGRISESIFKIIKFAKSKNIPILIDGASALGSKKNGIPILYLADISITSFSSSKLISSGQGGAVFTNKKKLSEKIKTYKNFGRKKLSDDVFKHYGLNFKISDILSLLANSQLKRIQSIKEKKQRVFKRYIANLGKNNFFKTNFNENINSYVDFVGCKNEIERNKLIKELSLNNFDSRMMFPALNKHYLYKNISGNAKNSNRLVNKGILLPSNIDLSNKQIDLICKISEKYI